MTELTPEQEKHIDEVFADLGKTSAEEIIAIAKILHPDAEQFIPLYRSCLVICKRDHPAEVLKVIAYHDPAWLGLERNTDTLVKFQQVYIISGQRDRVDIFKFYEMDGFPTSEVKNETEAEGEMMTMDEAISRKGSEKFWAEVMHDVQVARDSQAKYNAEHPEVIK